MYIGAFKKRDEVKSIYKKRKSDFFRPNNVFFVI